MITGIVLSGGESSRMGRNKSLLNYKGKPMIHWIVETIRPYVGEIIVVTNQIELYQFLEGVTFREDIIKGKGPMGGIYTGLHYSQTNLSFVVACDMPFMTGALIPFLANQVEDTWGAIPYNGKHFETLAAIYHKELEGFFYSFLKGEIRKLQYLLRGLNVKRVDVEDIYVSFGRHIFENINTQENYQKILEDDHHGF